MKVVSKFFERCAAGLGSPATELSAGKAASTVSHHLAKLEKAGILRARRDGKTKRYFVEAAQLHALAAWMSSCATDVEFSGFDEVLLSVG
ncbi:helix-turn-helix domain-containing protein [Devosia submarina]|uniref:ArsR/SmtB family transcription factor n=1 Tax=Devosia submarina TaxID=1173082 RepID=UPI000D3484D0